ncbi:hypothetical protein K2173_018342 [Erythroxylum novogranatense]|uniref:Protein-serine/threonine phosphatase n=1 Tax=Erythroxylum novogranatense TaxID=1862640 RepID=A0AAV8UCT3_9ROSI|nr:hypothetical protein K2173_018342 [Erythroxylum novogranatense]
MTVTTDGKLLVLGFVTTVCSAIICSGEERSTCLMVYKEGGAPAVLRSPKCPRWNLPNYDSGQRTAEGGNSRCQSASLQGRRKSQEDRILCHLDLQIPFPGKGGLKQVKIGIVAVFDGHNGAEASDMASKLLLEYFALHTYFLLDAAFSFVSTGRLPDKAGKEVFQLLYPDQKLSHHDLNFKRFKLSLRENVDNSFHLDILKEALLRAIHDIDSTFSKEAYRDNLDSGSTATIVLIADGQILVANVGDSKALLCSEKFLSPAEAKASLLRLYREKRRSGVVSPRRDYDVTTLSSSKGLKSLIVEELTRDHHPGRDDEKFRVENAGGYVLEWGGVARVNGQLAVSRAIGDVSFKNYGVISAPEVTDWQPITSNKSYLVVASDGVFEKLSLQDVCDLLWQVHIHDTEKLGLSNACSYSLAECLVNTAFEKGTMDNMAAVVVPLSYIRVSQKQPREKCVREGDMYSSTFGLNNIKLEESAHDLTSDLVQLGHLNPLTTKFDRLLVEGKYENFACYYLLENLDDKLDALQVQRNGQDNYEHDLPQALPKSFSDQYGGPLNLYSDQNLCLNIGMDGGQEQCINAESFATFLTMLESVPFYDSDVKTGTTEYAIPNMRYALKKRFGRGSYGEVWLAFRWNCHEDNNDSMSGRNKNVSFNFGCFRPDLGNSSHSSGHECNDSSPEPNLFILKRIMVERGTAVYLSGLREKYFGEVFLNASRCLGGSVDDGITTTMMEESQIRFNDIIMNDTVYGSGNMNFKEKFRLQSASFEEGLNHIARYVESFESRLNEIWLVFHHEGISLSKLMYTMEEVKTNDDEEKAREVKHVQILRPSKWWHWMKTTKAGKEEMRNLIWQLLMALKSCHDRNITHRDIKPENMVICLEDKVTGVCLKGVPSKEKNYTTKMHIIDFGSGIDDFTLKYLYGSGGPSRTEQTYEYAPPEALLNVSWYKGSTCNTLKYDMWSVGVVILELILGSPNVFQISSLTQALLDRHIEGWNEDLKELAYKLDSLYLLPCLFIFHLLLVGNCKCFIDDDYPRD